VYAVTSRECGAEPNTRIRFELCSLDEFNDIHFIAYKAHHPDNSRVAKSYNPQCLTGVSGLSRLDA
jgi:hypothetical protein